MMTGSVWVETAVVSQGSLPWEQMGWGGGAPAAWAGKHVKNTLVWTLRALRVDQCEAGRYQGPDTSDVEGTVSRTHIANAYQEDIDQSPDAQASKAEQLAQTFPPLAQVEPVSSKTPKCDATKERRDLSLDPPRAQPAGSAGPHLSANAVDHL